MTKRELLEDIDFQKADDDAIIFIVIDCEGAEMENIGVDESGNIVLADS